jgi:thiamine-monophosphate kinase
VPAGTPHLREAAITIGDLGEFGLIAAMRALLPGSAAQIVGIGDDAAVLRAPDGRVVATIDQVLEDRHFRRGWSAPFDVGCKAAARSLADIAAMGATATALLVGFAAPPDLPVTWAEELVRGLAAECARAGASVAGGDVSSAESVMLSVTALGDLAGRRPVTRGGARPGDMVAVAGRLGHSAAGLALLQADREASAAPLVADLIGAHRRPEPPYRAGPQAADLGATAMIDISDGLVADLGHVASESGVQIRLRSGALDEGGALRAASALLPGADWLAWALAGGEDHALAATFPGGTILPAGWRVIGSVTDGSAVLVDGRVHPGRTGWDHFPCGH